jgi:hypothetical protein
LTSGGLPPDNLLQVSWNVFVFPMHEVADDAPMSRRPRSVEVTQMQQNDAPSDEHARAAVSLIEKATETEG